MQRSMNLGSKEDARSTAAMVFGVRWWKMLVLQVHFWETMLRAQSQTWKSTGPL